MARGFREGKSAVAYTDIYFTPADLHAEKRLSMLQTQTPPGSRDPGWEQHRTAVNCTERLHTSVQVVELAVPSSYLPRFAVGTACANHDASQTVYCVLAIACAHSLGNARSNYELRRIPAAVASLCHPYEKTVNIIVINNSDTW